MTKQTEILALTDSHIETYEGDVLRSAFEAWVDDNELREFCNVVSRNGEPHETTGTLSWEDYYDGGGAEFDLCKFLTVRDNTGRLKSLPDMQKSLTKLFRTL